MSQSDRTTGQIGMRRRAAGETAAPSMPVFDVASVKLLDLDLLASQWNQMSVAEKAARITSKIPSLPIDNLILLISRLDSMNPPERVIEYRERVVCVPVDMPVDAPVNAPVQQPTAHPLNVFRQTAPVVGESPGFRQTAPVAPPPSQTLFIKRAGQAAPVATGTNMLAWGLLLVISAGILYATVEQKP